MALEVHVGEPIKLDVTLFDKDGNETNDYDQVSGLQWNLSHPDAVELATPDISDPKDAELRFTRLTPDGEEATVACTFDGAAGDTVDEHTIQGDQGIVCVAGPAVAGVIHVLKMIPESA